MARASGLSHVAGCTGTTSEDAVRKHFNLPLEAMLDMGDFAGGVLKYLRSHPVARLTIGGGFGKMVKLAQGHMDLHSGRSQVDFAWLAERVAEDLRTRVLAANTALEVLRLAGNDLAQRVAKEAQLQAAAVVRDAAAVDVMVVSREGQVIGHAA